MYLARYYQYTCRLHVPIQLLVYACARELPPSLTKMRVILVFSLGRSPRGAYPHPKFVLNF